MHMAYLLLVIGWFGGQAEGILAVGSEAVGLTEFNSPEWTAEESANPTSPQQKEKNPSQKSSPQKSAQTSPAPPSEKAQPPKKQEEAADPFKVPEGSPEELLKYIDGLRQLKAKDITTREQMIDFLRKLHTAMAEAADKVLAGKPTPEQADQAIQAKGQGLIMLLQLGDPTAEDRFEKFIEQLQKEGKKEMARQARGILLLVQWRHIEGVEEKKKHLEKIFQFLGEDAVEIPELRLMFTVGQELELRMPELAVDAYRQFRHLAAKSKLPIAEQLVKRWEAVLRRLELPGKPIEIQGFTLDGKEFEWEKFRQGKVVLIDFWATWCDWCVKEIPEMKRLYQAYRDRGFEIVGINGDEKREDLDKFLQNVEIPWTILYGKEGPSPTVQYYGISSWPTMLLVGKDGTVLTLNARGEKLREELKRLLGPIEEKPEPKSSKE